MTSRRIASLQSFVYFAAVLSFGTPALAGGPDNPLHLGNWNGGSYTNDATGQFTHCAAGSVYNSGITFFVAVGRTYQWSLGFTHPDWRLTIGQIIPVDLSFDGSGRFRVYGKAIGPSLVEIAMPANSKLIRLFRGARQMTAFANGNLYGFSLLSTSQLLPALVQCVQNKIGLPPPPAPATRTAVAPPIASPANLPPNSTNVSSLNPTGQDLHEEAVDVATNFILSSNLQSAHLVSRDQTPVSYVAFGAAWNSSEGSGSARIIQGTAATKGIDVTAMVIEADAAECKGKFASARTSELIDSDVVFHGVSSCQDSAGDRSAEYFVVPRKKGGFVLFSVVAPSGGSLSDPDPTKTQTTRFETAALKSIQ